MPGIFSNRENDRIELRTNDLSVTKGNTGERIRIMHIGALNAGENFNPENLANNLTRVSISHNPATPVTRPLSLLHLGYNTQSAIGDNNGWRRWMDVGMYVSQESDHVYIGLKDEGNDRKDAVLNWGDNQVNAGPAGAGPDNFRMIFTSTPFPLAGGTAPAIGADGLEGLRMTPTQANGIHTGIGGDPTANLYGPANNSVNPTATLEVNAWGATNALGGRSGLRFTNLNSTSPDTINPGNGVLSVNEKDDVIYVEANTAPAIGGYCPSGGAGPLTDHFEVPLNDFSYSFTAKSGSNNLSTVNIGNVACGTLLPARLYVQQSEPMPDTSFYTAITGVTDGTNLTGWNSVQAGVYGLVSTSISEYNAGVYGVGTNSTNSFGTQRGFGVRGEALGNDINVGVYGEALSTTGLRNWGIYGRGNGSASVENLAGYFEGNVKITGNGWVNGSVVITSDRRLKTSIVPLTNALNTIKRLKPASYFMDTLNTYGLQLAKNKQYGLIAQDVELILPELVHSTTSVESKDSTGKLISQSTSYKGIEYNALIPILIAAMQEQQVQIEAKDSLLNALNDKFTKLENCINRLNLCNNEANYRTIGNTANTDSDTKENTTAQSVKLSDPQSIVLNQNVPNPFAEKTAISYYLPKSVKSAKIIFHNQEGKLINSIDIAERGNGSLNVYADDLSSGIYTYTLIADDNVIDTKRMVKN